MAKTLEERIVILEAARLRQTAALNAVAGLAQTAWLRAILASDDPVAAAVALAMSLRKGAAARDFSSVADQFNVSEYREHYLTALNGWLESLILTTKQIKAGRTLDDAIQSHSASSSGALEA